MLTILGGLSEFIVSIAVLMALSACLGENINQGVVLSILVANVVIVSIGSYILFNELLSVLQVSGIIFVIVSVIITSLFGPESKLDKKQEAIVENDGHVSKMFLVVIWGVIAAVFLGIKILT